MRSAAGFGQRRARRDGEGDRPPGVYCIDDGAVVPGQAGSPPRSFDVPDLFDAAADRPRDLDFVVVRENTEGEYSQIGGHLKKDTPDEVALVNGVYTWKGCERACRYAFELARKGATARGRTGKPKVTLVDKANAIRPHDIWTRALVGRRARLVSPRASAMAAR
jgi:hypothetical protein